MKKVGLLTLGVALIFLFIVFITDDFDFGPKAGGQGSFYPPTQEFKAATESVLDEVLLDRIFDLDWRKIIRITSFFESLDGYDITLTGSPARGSIALTTPGQQVTFTTGNQNNDSVQLAKQPNNQSFIGFTRKSRLRTNVQLDVVTSQTIYITVGNIPGGGQGYGFKVTNATLYGVTDNGTTENAVELQTLSADTKYSLEARYLPSNKVIFYVDDVTTSPVTRLTEAGVSTSNLPSPADSVNTSLFYAYIQNNVGGVGSERIMWMTFWEYSQLINAPQ